MDKDLPRRLLRHKNTRRLAAGLAVFILGMAVLAALTAPQEAAPQSRRIVREMPPFQTASAESKSSYWLEEAVHEGDTLESMLKRYGLTDTDIAAALGKDGADKKLLRLHPGQTVSVLMDGSGSPAAIQFFNDDDNGEKNLIALGRIKGKWQASTSEIEMKTLPTLVSVVVRTSAKGSLAQAGVGVELRELLRDIFRDQFDVDGLQEGDQIRLLYDTMYFRGQEMGSGDILGAEIVKGGKTYRAYYYDKGDGAGGYYNYEGEPLKSENANGGFMYMPLQNYTRISSPYGIRVHPILHTVKMHTGIDYAAPVGTPVYAPADGTITFKGWKGGYGHAVVMEHGGGVETIYGHLSAFSPAAGRVRAGEVIGFVGTSGRSTGPHLHYEARINGQHVNPATVALPTPKMEKISMGRFLRQRQHTEDIMEAVAGLPVTAAQIF